MIESILDTLSLYLYESFWVAIFSSFGWGILSVILSPCHLSTIPLIIGFLSSNELVTFKRTLALSIAFAFGILITIALIGGLTLGLGAIAGDIGPSGNYIVAIVFIVVGLYLLDIIKLPWNSARLSGTKYKGMLAAFVLGLITGLGLGPCTFAFIAPVLGVVFDVSSSDIWLASGLLIAFALGHSLVIMFAGVFTNLVQRIINWNGNSKLANAFKKAAGILVILGGFYFIYSTL